MIKLVDMSNRKHTCFLALIFCTIQISCSKKGGDPPPPVVPAISISDAFADRTTTGSVMHFNLSLNKTTTVPVSVDYSFTDGTAKSPTDYTATSGTITIPAGSALASLEVPVKADATDKRQKNLEFTVNLGNPKSCTIGVSAAKGTIITENGINLTTDNAGYSTPNNYPGYTLAWNDEFAGNALDLNAWNQEIGNGTNGWGNNELEYYTNSTKNCFVSNGNLVIEARKETISGFNYSSSRLTTQNKKTFTFGRVDIRAKLPVGKGIWPALWMLGNNISSVGWPACGEIDIMELIGTYPGRVHSTFHWRAANGNHASMGSQFNLSSGDFSQQFHVYSLIWKQDTLQCLVDDQLIFQMTKTDVGSANYPFNAAHFFIFNVAVGGNWPGPPDANTEFPQRMFVDYIRVFQ
jgi:beta-glucanase (GH16 family)